LVIGEAMIELSAVRDNRAQIGVAGDTFNTAVYLSRSGLPTSYVSAVGDDPFSARVLEALAAERINASGVAQLKDKAVGLYAVSVDDRGERSFTYWRSESAARSLFAAPKISESLDQARKSDLLYLSGITLSLYPEEERHRLYSLLAAIRDRGGRVAFDSNFRPRGWSTKAVAREAISIAIEHATITLPTFDDEALLFGDETPEDCLRRHEAAGVEETIVKHGGEGALSSVAGWIRPPDLIEPTDTTGAGDSFNAAYLAARIRGETIANSVAQGHELAARVLLCPGAILPTGAR